MASVLLLFLFPFFWMVSNALRSNAEIFTSPPRWLPVDPQWGNFGEALTRLPFGRFFLNSAIVSGASTLLVIVVATLSAYAFARIDFRGKSALFTVFLSTLMIPQILLVIPLFLVVNTLRWVNTFQGMIIPMVFSAFGTFLLRQFFMGIPGELEDAARIDGASRLRILVSIFVPLALPAIGLLALFTFIGQWNSFLWPLIVVNDTQLATIPLGLAMFRGESGTSFNYLMAGASISMVPGVILAVLLQKAIYKNITMGTGFGGK